MKTRRRTAVYPRTGALALLSLCLAGPGIGGPVTTSGSASHAGSAGLRVQVDAGACSATENTRRISGGTIGSDQRACETLAADNATVASPDSVRFSAGYRLSFGAGFGVEQGAEFAAAVDTARVRGGFVRDDSPRAESHYAARFQMNADNLDLTVDEQLVLLRAEDGTGRSWFSIVLDLDGSNAKQMRVVTPDATGTAESTPFQVDPGWQAVEVEWRAAEPGSADGRVWVTRDGTAQPGLSGLDNPDGRIELVRWGLLRALSTTGGYLDLDSFVSRRAGTIGPP